MIRLPDSSASRTHCSASPSRDTSSSIGLTYAGAPPWSGPESAPTADESAAPQSAPVDATTRAVNVEALRPCSAVQIQYVSIALESLRGKGHGCVAGDEQKGGAEHALALEEDLARGAHRAEPGG